MELDGCNTSSSNRGRGRRQYNGKIGCVTLLHINNTTNENFPSKFSVILHVRIRLLSAFLLILRSYVVKITYSEYRDMSC